MFVQLFLKLKAQELANEIALSEQCSKVLFRPFSLEFVSITGFTKLASYQVNNVEREEARNE